MEYHKDQQKSRTYFLKKSFLLKHFEAALVKSVRVISSIKGFLSLSD